MKITAEKSKELVEKKLNKLAYKIAEESLESECSWVIHQPKLTDEVKKALKKC